MLRVQLTYDKDHDEPHEDEDAHTEIPESLPGGIRPQGLQSQRYRPDH